MPADESANTSATNETSEESNSPGFQMSLIAGHNIWEWIFLVVSLWNVALLFASSGIALFKCDISYDLLSTDFITEILAIITSAIALIFAVYGVHEEHKFDMFLHLTFVIIADFFSYLAVYKNCYSCIKFICFCVSVGMSIFNCFVAYKATSAADWTEFRIIGASESLARMYKKQCAFLALLKFDCLFVIICAIYSFPITLEFSKRSYLYALLILIIMYSLMSWSCGKVTVCKEDKYLASGFIVLCITYPCLIIYQLCMSSHKSSSDSFIERQETKYMNIVLSIGIIIIICKLLLAFLMIQTCRTFGYGLNTRSLDILKKWLDRPSKNKSSSERGIWLKFLKDCCHLKCSSKTKEMEYTYKDIYRF